MKMPFLYDLSGNTHKVPLLFRGLNQSEVIDDSEFSAGINIDPTKLPAISPRQAMQVVKRIEKPQTIGVCYENLVYCSNGKFYFNGVHKGNVIPGRKTFIDFNNKVIIIPDNKVYDYTEDAFENIVMPDFDYAVSYYNRIFGIKGSDIRASKLGDATVWEEFNGTAMDSWAGDVYSHGDFTGLTAYQDHLVFFKRDAMYELYGYLPSQYKVQDASTSIGCIDDRSIVEIAGVLYFVSEKGIYAYQGGQPRPISDPLNEVYIKASAITDGRTYYVSLFNGIDHKVYAYDTWNRSWTPYADLDVVDFVKSGEIIYALTESGELILFSDSSTKGKDHGKTLPWESMLEKEEIEPIRWSVTTKKYDDGIYEKKSIKAIRLRCNMDIGATVKIYINLDNSGWELKRTFTNTGIHKEREIIMKITLERASIYQLRIEGTGRSLIYGEKEVVVGSDR